MPPFITWFFLLFGAWLAYLCITGLLEKRRNLAQARQAATWPSAAGTVLSSQIVEGSYYTGGEPKQKIFTCRPEVEYLWEAGGQPHKGSRLAFGKILYYQPAEAEAFMTKHTPGALVTVYHDPAHPAHAVLDRDPAHATHLVAADFGMLIAGLVMTGAGICGLISG